VPAEVQIDIATDGDVVTARAKARALADTLGFRRIDATEIATAISEVTRNIIVHVGNGEVVLSPIEDDQRRGVVVIARDCGGGIADVEAAMREGYGTKGGLGLGLPGARRLMDEFDIQTAPGEGTTVIMKKWRQRDELERLTAANGSR
jgi:serine/threonine-protein kinase RsbT